MNKHETTLFDSREKELEEMASSIMDECYYLFQHRIESLRVSGFHRERLLKIIEVRRLNESRLEDRFVDVMDDCHHLIETRIKSIDAHPSVKSILSMKLRVELISIWIALNVDQSNHREVSQRCWNMINRCVKQSFVDIQKVYRYAEGDPDEYF